MTICPDCNMVLVERLNSRSSAAFTPDDSWTEVCAVKTNARAEAARNALDEENIPSVLMSSRFLNLGGGMVTENYTLPGGYRAREISIIMVPREFLDDAEMIVENVLGDDFIPLDEP